ncbi:MAG TPA: peptide deformylase [Fimbriimonadaceae bacterium]|nr:peptide deformylase [Fimbriimonadaceae bacterium]
MKVVVPDEYKYLYVTDDEHPIVKIPAPVLYEKAVDVERVTKRHQMLADNMQRIMRAARGVGLAAPQIGVSERLIVVAPENRPTVIFNPKVLKAEGSQIGEEGCLSIPGLYGDVDRAEFVEIGGLDRKGRESTWEMDGIAARVALHEIDHLDGILFTEKVDPATLYWQHPSEKNKAE